MTGVTPRTPAPIQLSIDAWAPGYGSAMEPDLQPAAGSVDINREVEAAEWRPLAPIDGSEQVHDVVFVDGVRRIDARVWATGPSGRPDGGLAVSIAAGAVRTNRRAAILDARVDRLIIGPAGTPSVDAGGFIYRAVVAGSGEDGDLMQALQHQLSQLERRVVDDLDVLGLLVVDGPLTPGRQRPMSVGYIKTHHTQYLPPSVVDTVRDLRPGTRTPLFVVTGSWERYSWYLRLADAPGHPWAGVVRVEASGDQPLTEVIALADLTAASLPRFASRPHRDPRAPQNLVPIGGLEQQLKRRLGNAQLLERRLRVAVAGQTPRSNVGYDA